MKYTITVPFWKDDPRITYANSRIDWCEQNIGRKQIAWTHHSGPGEPAKFYFEKEEHAILFALRWA